MNSPALIPTDPMLSQYDLRSLVQVHQLYPEKATQILDELIRRVESGAIIENTCDLDDIETEGLVTALCRRMGTDDVFRLVANMRAATR